MVESLESSVEQRRLIAIAEKFAGGRAIASVAPLGNGNINSTFLVTTTEPDQFVDQSVDQLADQSADIRFVLQRINQQVFRQPDLVIHNMAVLSEHLKSSVIELPRPWQTPCLIATQQGKYTWIDESGEYWRAISFIEDCTVCETVESVVHAKEVGYGLAMFHRLISQLPVHKLADTLPGFHITPTYLAHYAQVLSERANSLDPDSDQDSDPDSDPDSDQEIASEQAEQIQYCLSFIEARKDWASVLEQAKAVGQLQLRPIHGDPKVNNIMMDARGKAMSLIDLDTLKPGLVHYDIGDCLRSGCNLLGEETEDWQHVVFDAELAQAMLQGYLSLAKDFLSEPDYDYLYDGIRLIAFELGLRFFTDYLAGNVYFKVKHPTHNLMRSLVQFKLTESIEAQETTIRSIIQTLRMA
jgi:Phosphotransferase enzyme family